MEECPWKEQRGTASEVRELLTESLPFVSAQRKMVQVCSQAQSVGLIWPRRRKGVFCDYIGLSQEVASQELGGM